MAKATKTGSVPPYLAYSRFESFVALFSGKQPPSRYDRSLVRSMSGAEQSQLGITLRFFKLVSGADNLFTERFKRLAAANGKPEAWKDALTELLGEYDTILEGIDTNSTNGQLADAFRDRGNLNGSAHAKAIRFYLTLARTAGVELSSHFTAPTIPVSASSSGDKPKRAKRGSKTPRSADSESESSLAPTGTKKLRFSLPSGDVQVWLPEKITIKELDALAKYLTEYVTLMTPT